MSLPVNIIIVAGGSGVRMGGDIPKQFLEIGGKPILRHTIELFLNLPFEVKMVLVMNEKLIDYWKQYCRENEFFFPHILVEGGITRYHSVKKGLKYVKNGEIVAVHDAVRPFIPNGLLNNLFMKAETVDALVPVLKMVDSVRMIDENMTTMVDRDKCFIVQTPQIFKSDILLKSYKSPYSTAFTDDASVVEAAGFKLSFSEGFRYNIKITTPDDLKFAEVVIKSNLLEEK